MTRGLTIAASIVGVVVLAFLMRWIFKTDLSFGFGMFSGIALMVLLYWIAERTGIRETRY